MGRFTTAAIIALALAGAAVESRADDLAGAAPASVPMAAPSPDAPPPLPGGPMGWAGRPDMRSPMRGPMGRMHQMEQSWGLFFNQPDKNLSDSDVQVLAEAILLAHGNHDWKVIDVADAADGQVTFAYAVADGSVVARFEIDRHSGRIARIG
jgi:hypothetical protein